MLREYVVSEAMAALGIPTTRALAVVTTGEGVLREEMLPGAMLTRVAASHLRVGTFEFFAARADREALVALTAYALARHYPHAAGSGNDALALLEQVIDAQASLVARWLGVGFVHGVMNTDNTAISGETLDYGPCAFLDEYDPNKRFSSIDHQGRYAFSNQPRIAHWNMIRLAEALLSLLSEDEEEAVRLARERLQRFPARFEAAHLRVLRAKLGLAHDDPARDADDRVLAHDLLGRLAQNHVDYTLFFRRLCASADDPSADAAILPLFDNPDAFRTWAETWRHRQAAEALTPGARASSMRRSNAAFIPHNHRVEERSKPPSAAATSGPSRCSPTCWPSPTTISRISRTSRIHLRLISACTGRSAEPDGRRQSGHAVRVADTRLSMSPTPPASAPQGAAAASGPSPCLRLRVETVLVPDGDRLLGAFVKSAPP